MFLLISVIQQLRNCNMKIGIDLVHIPSCIERMKSANVLTKVFSEAELRLFATDESRAGVFAAKEACMKAFGKKMPWDCVQLSKNQAGAPVIACTAAEDCVVLHVSISHDQEYATACVVIE